MPGSIGASATSDTKATSGVAATALAFGDYSYVGDPTAAAGLCGTIAMTAGLCNSNEQGAGHGTITAQVNGVLGGEATAISISSLATLPSLVNLGTISGQRHDDFTHDRPEHHRLWHLRCVGPRFSKITNIEHHCRHLDNNAAEQQPHTDRLRSRREHDLHHV